MEAWWSGSLEELIKSDKDRNVYITTVVFPSSKYLNLSSAELS